jgi:hypothetical protein
MSKFWVRISLLSRAFIFGGNICKCASGHLDTNHEKRQKSRVMKNQWHNEYQVRICTMKNLRYYRIDRPILDPSIPKKKRIHGYPILSYAREKGWQEKRRIWYLIVRRRAYAAQSVLPMLSNLEYKCLFYHTSPSASTWSLPSGSCEWC